MPTFSNSSSPTPYAFFDGDAAFQSEADNFVELISFHLGNSVIQTELSKKTIWANLEFSVLEFSSLINSYAAKSTLTDYLGLPSGSLSGSQDKYPRKTLEFVSRQAEANSAELGLGSAYNTISGSISLEKDRQDYDIYTELMDSNNNPVFQSQQATGSRGRLKIIEVKHFEPDVSFLALTASPSINYLSAEFSFESFSRGTHFYVLPVFEDVLRQSMYDLAFKVRRSNFSYRVQGTKIRIFPKPTQQDPKKLFIRVTPPPDPTKPSFDDDTIFGVSNISNLPFGELVFSKINSIGKQWIRNYALALCRITLGHIRSKFKAIPIPGNTLELDGAEMLARGVEDKEKLKEELKELLESLTYDQLMLREAEKAENLNRTLKYVPIQNPIWVF